MSTSVDIYNKIKSACLSNTNIKSFALWNGQPMKQKEGSINPVRYPATFVQFENNYNLVGNGVAEIDGVFVIYLCVESLKHKDEDILTLKDSLTQSIIFNLKKNGFGDVWKSFEVQDIDHTGGLMIWQMEFQYGYFDNTTADVNYSLTGWTMSNNINYELPTQ